MVAIFSFETAYLKKDSVSTNVGHSYFFSGLLEAELKKIVAHLTIVYQLAYILEILYRVEVKVQNISHLNLHSFKSYHS